MTKNDPSTKGTRGHLVYSVSIQGISTENARRHEPDN